MAAALTVTINGMAFTNVIRARVGRDLEQIAGTFDLTLVDQARLSEALLAQIGQPTPNGPVNPGDAITILIDGEPVLVGRIEQPRFGWEAGDITCRVHGRDKTGDLVDCTPPPALPVQFRGVDLLAVANQVCAPFGIPVTADVDIGAPFDCLVRHKHMTAMGFLESAARQRSVLLTSNGIGGLVLTRGGTTRAPAALSIGDNVWRVETEYDWTRRFSDYWVMQDTGLTAAASAAPGLLIGSVPDDTEPEDAADATAPAPGAATGSMGHATDPEITRYRPTVRLTRSQSGMSTLQEQAEWMCRVAKGNSIPVHLSVRGFRSDKTLWRPNQLTAVWEPYSRIDRDTLIAGVEFERSDEGGDVTRLRLVGPTAYDRINEADRRNRHGKKAKAAPTPADLITTVPGT